MNESFVLSNAKEMFHRVSETYFRRYDLHAEWAKLNKEIGKWKQKIGRGPFIYELIDKFLLPLKKPLREKVRKVLFTKDREWFHSVGQYFLYNTHQWSTSFSQPNSNPPEERKQNLFLEQWWSNFLDFERAGHLKDQRNALPLPKKILLELTSNCNLNCVMCGIGKHGYDPSRNLSLEVLESLSDEVLSEAEIIRLNGLGESTILPNFLKYLEILGSLPVQLEIVTNLTVADRKIWEHLIERQTNFLISCDSAHASLYEAIRQGAHFAGFKKNLRYIGQNIADPLQAQIIFTLMEQNCQEVAEMVNLAANMGLGGVIVNVVKLEGENGSWMRQKFEVIKEEFHRAYELANSYGLQLKLPDHLGIMAIDEEICNPTCQVRCENPWEEVYLRYNGDLTVCNMLNPYLYGNCSGEDEDPRVSFAESWNGLNAQLFRRFVNTCYRHPYCKDCYYLV